AMRLFALCKQQIAHGKRQTANSAQQKTNSKKMTKTTGNNTVEKAKIAIIGLGYVGLPLAVEFAKKYPVVGFDINESRINELKQGHDRTLEIADNLLKSVLSDAADARGLTFSNSTESIRSCNYYIVTVPTPVDKY